MVWIGLVRASRTAEKNVHAILTAALRGLIRFRVNPAGTLEFAREDCEALAEKLAGGGTKAAMA